VTRHCPDGYYRGCDSMGCEGLLRSCSTFPDCPYRVYASKEEQDAAEHLRMVLRERIR
jgi:hypothetical protein